MNAGSICQRLAFTVAKTAAVVRAAQLMREKHVGYLVVVDTDSARERAPIGVLTDRDIVITVVAREIDPGTLDVGDIMSASPVTIEESASMEVALRKMREFGVRHLPVVDSKGDLAGVLGADDVLKVLGGDARDLVYAAQKERQVEGELRA
jgi:CBS domain-containing protein